MAVDAVPPGPAAVEVGAYVRCADGFHDWGGKSGRKSIMFLELVNAQHFAQHFGQQFLKPGLFHFANRLYNQGMGALQKGHFTTERAEHGDF